MPAALHTFKNLEKAKNRMRPTDAKCRLCKGRLDTDKDGVYPVECMREDSGIGIYFQNWCYRCQDRFFASDADIEINEILHAFLDGHSSKARPRRPQRPSCLKRNRSTSPQS